MSFFSKYHVTPAKVLKSVLIAAGVLIILTFFLKLANLPTLRNHTGGFGFTMQSMPSSPSSFDEGAFYAAEDSISYGGNSIKGLSVRNVLPILPPRIQAPGNDAEAYEITEYSALFESGDVKETCDAISAWKALSHVIFEQVSESKRQCSVIFKVEHAHTAAILSALEALGPKDVTEHTSTIKQQIADFTSQTEILEKKQSSIDKTLDTALRSYDEITALATRTQNAEALAKIIDSKIGIIERLTQQRIEIAAQLDQLARAKEEQLDRLSYTYFTVNVYEHTFIDREQLGDSWKAAIKDLVRTINEVLQSLTIGLLAFLLWMLPFAVYAGVVFFVAVYAWRMGKRLWEK